MARRDAPLPTGLVTFLLTDIEGSTQAWQTAPDEMTAIVSRHYQILDAAVATRGGVRPQEQGEGDSIVAVFVDPVAAVTTALEAQLALRRELPDLPVRMALHTGETMLRNEDNYVGLTIIRCARIRSSGYGGQILLSDETTDAVRGALTGGTDIIDLGLYGLRGLDGRARVWQLTHPELPTDFRPLRAGTSAAGNLPSPITSFIGRRTELTTVGNSLEQERLITLTGEAGVGKSRLAQAAGDAAANAMTGGVWWIPVGGSSDDIDAIAGAVIRACALDRPDDDPLDTITEHFRSIADSLVVFDGFEAAPQATAAVIDRLLTRCPDVSVLATGRDSLRLPGEIVHRLEPMPVPGADVGSVDDLHEFAGSRLFVERGVNARAGASFPDSDAIHIARVCRQLRGVPLGIELAAARSGTTSMAELADSLAVLADEGQRSAGLADTLSSSIAWTYQFVDAEAQTALRRLGIFRGDFEIDAATAVVAGPRLGPRAAAVAIRHLLDQHLIAHDASSTRFTMSTEIRAFAHARLVESDDLAATTERHGDWYASVAERFGAGGADMPDSMLALDLADLISALESAMAGRDPAVAYRIIIGIGSRLPALGQRESLEIAARWLADRTPSDGEDRWAAAIARTSVALADRPDEAIHAFVPEALAIAELARDDETASLLREPTTTATSGTDRSVTADMASPPATRQD